MVDNMWAFELEDKIFSYIKYKASKYVIGNVSGKDITLKDKFPKINFTSTNLPANKEIAYPTVYIHALPAVETGSDIHGTDINAVMYTTQIDVVTNTSQSDANKVISVISCILKDLGFQITAFPSFDNGTTYYRSVMRLRRMIGQHDFSEGVSSLE